ncbi:uncharacterized protein L969DRAFT_90705 [Mixia osmundae IAM 14324]|uniref:Uncharacterized protein n=1 Tax=Mixia osmundae (strain CBS 9802 / IAM 14324 / JCM 22182 / KY 12970) TaxID=764103 RepID=G7E1R8_MIXOS|nr:uncharacterized protein L969DRAFT_90705 [Mixia osmundae IAM 14324]KEI36727.1 hypothetical protein L969DRAFT_90705 [Mixia osmundae IAM 14324]GAA96778.1 hypothetical protein E5Q_03449 [Mixia osmundae IAM 14324]
MSKSFDAANMANYSIEKLFDVNGLVCVISGGGTGIGLMLTQALAANGAKVYIVGDRGNAEDAAVEQYNGNIKGKIIAVKADMRTKDSIATLVKEIESKESYVDLVIPNAGIAGPGLDPADDDAEEQGKRLFDADYDEALNLFKTNVLGYYYLSAAFIPLLSKAPGSPQIVSITSNAAFGRTSMVGPLYSASKAASVHLAKMLSTHLSKTNIRVNTIAPGLFPAELTKGDSDSKNKSQLGDSTIGLNIPRGRPGTDLEMAHAILFLASRNQTYTNGSVVMIDGGVLTQMPSTY